MDLGITGKNAIICASSGGLGKGVAKQLALEGVGIDIHGTREDNHAKTDTEFIKKHPIGSAPIIRKAGQDCTEDFNFHRESGKKVWKKYKIGYIKTDNYCVIN